MKTISRYIMTLALLITAASGAWAAEELTETIITTGYSGSNLTVNGTYFKVSGTQFRSDGGYNGVRIANGKTATISLIDPNSSAKATKIVLYPDGGDTDVQYAKIDGAGTYSSTDVTVSKDVSITNDGSATISWGGNVNYGVSISKIEITYTAGPVVNINDAKTEATFAMPAFDATADYELVRDMSVQMTAQVGDGTQEQPRYRVKKDGNNKFIPADMEITAVPALFTVNDGIENNKVLTQTTDYIVQIYAIDAEGQPTGEAMTFATFTFEPGIYAVKAVAAQGSDYDGETALSNTFKLYDYINITFPKGYSTHYYNESLVLDEISNSLKFYAVTAVTSEKVTLTEIEGKAIPGGTPFIVYNETAEPITAVMGMLQADDVTSAEQFKGTAEDKSMGSQSNCYILRNGDSTPTFRLVEGAGTLPAHRCYIDLGAVAHTRSLGFDFGDGTTGIDSVESGELKVDSYYDLQGRKHQGTPQRKGVYVKDGRKVIVR